MTAVHFNPPPELAEYLGMSGPGACLICLLYAKGHQVTRTRETWQALANDGETKGPAAWMPYAEDYEIREGVGPGISDLFPGQLLPSVCWDHMGAIAPAAPTKPCSWCNGTGAAKSQIEQATALPPGLANHRRRGALGES